MKPPIAIADLPPALAKAVREDDGLWDDAIEAFADWLDEHQERPPAVLVMLSFMTYRHALEVMVDEVDQRGRAALALLDEAGLDTKQTRALRAQIERSIERDRATAAQIERTKAHPLEPMDRDALRSLACKLAESKAIADQAMAARAWVLAAGFESEPREKDDCLGRAALHFADAGNWAEASPRLEEILRRPGDYESWLPDYAWYRFLDKALAENDVPTFREHWSHALAMERKDDHFPVSRPAQASYLGFAVKHGLADVAAHLVDIIMKHRPPRLRKPLAPLLDDARALMTRTASEGS